MVRSVDSGTGFGTTGALLALSFSEDHASGGRRATYVFPPSECRSPLVVHLGFHEFLQHRSVATCRSALMKLQGRFIHPVLRRGKSGPQMF